MAGEAGKRLDRPIEDIRTWSVGSGPVPSFVIDSFAAPQGAANPDTRAFDPRPVLEAALTEGTIPSVEPPKFQSDLPALSESADLALRKYLASRLIAAWIMFQANDIRNIARYLRLCLDTVLLFGARSGDGPTGLSRWKEAVRQADLWILHYCDPERLVLNLR